MPRAVRAVVLLLLGRAMTGDCGANGSLPRLPTKPDTIATWPIETQEPIGARDAT